MTPIKRILFIILTFPLAILYKIGRMLRLIPDFSKSLDVESDFKSITPRKFRILKVIYSPIFFIARGVAMLHLFPDFTRTLNMFKQLGSGFREYRQGQYETAFNIITPIADSESTFFFQHFAVSEARYYVGFMYYHGLGVRKDNILAEQYFQKAAFLGNENAEKYLRQIGKLPSTH